MKFNAIFYVSVLLMIHSGCIGSNSTDVDTSEIKGQIINGKKEGEWKSFYPNGEMAKIETYRNDSLNGPCINYNINGKVTSKAHYKMGVPVDTFLYYYANGNLNFKTWYDSTGREQGVFKSFHENGVLSQEGLHKDGKMEGVWKTYHSNGGVKTVEFYNENKKDSIWVYYDENGRKVKEERYSNDSLVENNRKRTAK